MNPLVAKLSRLTHLADVDSEAIRELCFDQRRLNTRDELLTQGQRPEHAFLLIEGWAMRYKTLPDGRRQVLSYMLPGDISHVHVFASERMDYSVRLLGAAQVAVFSRTMMSDLLERSPATQRALWRSSLVDACIAGEWLVNIGARDAYGRLAHLFAELWYRRNAVDPIREPFFELPMTQFHLAETVGTTTVHVNRTLKRMRADGLIDASGKVRIRDIDGLVSASGFDPSYLHLDDCT